ncbi:RagB/SusD family nutrient uptake outer membrane protein [Mariniphaga sediminis]|uniref:RagB/SusD family nutrient uptake outer membrane protein n=1 Tax=Mariniphaga sediminis TaxID=1628158 RepID=UPI003565E7E5
MNYRKLIISLIGLSAILLGCQDDWLDRQPLDQVTEAAFFKSPKDFTVYVNRFHTSTGGTYSKGDIHTDIAISNVSLPERLAGESTINDGPAYSYANIRRVNYVIEKTREWEGDFEEIKQAAGEAYYFRAFYYYGLLRSFGDVQWIDKVLEMDSPELYGTRDSRDFIADKIIADLDTAAMYLTEDKGDGYSRLPKWFALLLQSRVALFEGTWQKYHNGTVFGVDNANPDKYLTKAAEAAKKIMDSGQYEIYSTGDPENDYYYCFNWRDFSNHPECMRWTKMDLEYDINAGRKLFYLKYPADAGITKDLVNYYLCTDGLPIASSPLYQGDNTIEDEIKNRDPRMDQTIFNNDDILYVYEDESRVYYDTIFSREFQDMTHSNPTGYNQRKQYYEYFIYHHTQHEETPTLNDRYAEVLLNYAEAKAELGSLTQEDLNISINLLRDRVAMPHLILDDIPNDPNWKYPDLSPLINEVRRERMVELATENYRWDDLYRWAAIKYLNGKRPVGAKADQFHHDPGLPVTEDGHLDPYKVAYPNGYNFNLNRDYLWPIPESQVRLNPNLGQNPGWNQ